MSVAMMISAIEQAILVAESEGTEHLARGVLQLEGEITAILSIIDVALESFSIDDPLRADLEDMRSAALLAVAKAKALVGRTAGRPILRLV
jgi:hypothetical protein